MRAGEGRKAGMQTAGLREWALPAVSGKPPLGKASAGLVSTGNRTEEPSLEMPPSAVCFAPLKVKR